jgi:hypothetical protein
VRLRGTIHDTRCGTPDTPTPRQFLLAPARHFSSIPHEISPRLRATPLP